MNARLFNFLLRYAQHFLAAFMPQGIIYTAIASGSAVGSDVNLSPGTRIWAIAIPTITSGDLLIQGGFDTTSKNFMRLLDTRAPGSGDLRFATGVGSRMIMWPPDFPTPPTIRLETSVNQTGSNVTSFAILVR